MAYSKFSDAWRDEPEILGGLGALGGASAERRKTLLSMPKVKAQKPTKSACVSAEPAPAAKFHVTQEAAPKPPKAPKVVPDAENFLPAPNTTWSDAQEERAAVVEFEGGAPRDWAEALARLDPTYPPADVQLDRWRQFIDDCGRFLDGGWASRAAELGWGPLDLFGCDRERPFARRDHKGLLWLLNGGSIIDLQRNQATIQTERGVRQTYRRRPVEIGRIVLAWEIGQ